MGSSVYSEIMEKTNIPSITVKKSQLGQMWSKGLITWEQLQILVTGRSNIATMPRKAAEEYGLKI